MLHGGCSGRALFSTSATELCLAVDMAAAAVVPSSYRSIHTSPRLGQAALGQSLIYGRLSGDMRIPGRAWLSWRGSFPGFTRRVLSVFQKQHQCCVPGISMPAHDTTIKRGA